MKQLIVTEFVTMDGVMEAPGGEPSHPHTGWVMDYSSPEQEEYKFAEIMEAESHLLGRVTYESFAGAWPHYEGEFADKMNSFPKYVISKTLRDPEWTNTTVLGGDIVDEVNALKEGDGGPILVAGSRQLVHTLIINGLVDELRLMVFPVILGSGFRWYPESPDKFPFSLVDNTTFDSGVVVQAYRPAGS